MKKFQIKVQILMNEKGKVNESWRRKGLGLKFRIETMIARIPKHEKILI